MDRNVVFTCPRTGTNVQHRIPCALSEAPDVENAHVAVVCLACGSVHFVNSTTGKLLGGESGGDNGPPGARLPEPADRQDVISHVGQYPRQETLASLSILQGKTRQKRARI